MNRRVIAVLLAAAALAFSDKPKDKDPLEHLARLYEAGRYFELRDALAAINDDPSIEVEFYRGAVDQVFNRLDSAILSLERYLRGIESDPVRPWGKDARFLLADAFSRLGRYREAAKTCREISDRCGVVLDPEEKVECENLAGFWSALSEIPPPSVRVEKDTKIRMTDRHFPVRIGNRTVLFEYDTGSSVSALRKSVADDLGVAVYGPPVKIQTGTGGRIDGRVGVIREMSLGSVIIRNAVFLVLPDDVFLPEKVRAGETRGGFLGMPVLEALKEFTETRDGDLIIPARPQPRTEQNMGFSGFRPFVEIRYRGSRLSLCLDTGSTATVLYPPFFRIHRVEITNRLSPREMKLEAIGGTRWFPVRIIQEFSFKVGGKALDLSRVAVYTKITHSGSRCFHGNLGLDILPQCARMTFNFESMSFVLE